MHNILLYLFQGVVSLRYIYSVATIYGIVLCRLGFPDVRARGCQIGVVSMQIKKRRLSITLDSLLSSIFTQGLSKISLPCIKDILSTLFHVNQATKVKKHIEKSSFTNHEAGAYLTF